MPKMNKIQSGFTAGEVSRQVHGRVDNPRYEMAMQYLKNYVPIIQGPLLRRPGTKFVGYVKDSKNLPFLIPFQFSLTQNYMLEFGDKYVRFYQNEAQIVTNSSVNQFLFSLSGYYGQPGSPAEFAFTAIRSAFQAGPGEVIKQSSVVSYGVALELLTSYAIADVPKIKFVQKQDTLYLTHPNYMPSKLVRTGLNTWDLKQLNLIDGPYLPLNTYQTLADGATTQLIPSSPGFVTITTSSVPIVAAISTGGGGNAIRITTANPHGFNNGDHVFVNGVQGTIEANNITSSSAVFTNSAVTQAYWIAGNVSSTQIDLLSSTFVNAFSGSTGYVSPALFQLVAGSGALNGQQYWADFQVGSSQGIALRNVGLINNGIRYSGKITNVYSAAQASIEMDQGYVLPNTSAIQFWQMGAYNYINGFPSTCCFHQDRLFFSGAPGLPQELDASMSGSYEYFSASGSNLQVANNNALQFSLASQDLNAVRWMKSNSLGLLCGTPSGEWAVTTSQQNAALSPTNIKADQVTAFGSYDSDAILAGNAAIYIQRAQRKVRELLYFWQVGNFRSTNVSELSQHITAPNITKIVNQKEPHPTIWALRGDGNLLSLTYNRDDVTLTANAGWSRHVLGGRSDSSGSAPDINSLAVIPSGDTTYDELWLVVNRYMNGSTLGCIEYMSKPFDDFQPQEQAYHLDCGATYNSSIVVTGVTNGSACIITANNHGLANSSVVRFYNAVGLNISTTDINGIVNSSNQLNEKTFVVNSVTTNTFFIQDFVGNFINTNSSSSYVGSCVVNQLVTSISGLGWLAGEVVGVVADGGIHVNTSVTQAGVLNLAYPAAVVQVGYPYDSDGQMLRSHEGSAQGSAIGSTRRCNRVAFMLHNVGDFSFGPSFNNLIPAEFFPSDVTMADGHPPLFDGIHREGIESSYGFSDDICFRQSSGLPGMIQAVVRFIEENDV